MSIAIIDNGREYSDHAIYFVELEHPLGEVLAALECMTEPEWSGRSLRVVGTAESVEWLGDVGTTRLADAVGFDWYARKLVDDEDEPTALTEAGRRVPLWALEMAAADGWEGDVWRWIIAAREADAA